IVVRADGGAAVFAEPATVRLRCEAAVAQLSGVRALQFALDFFAPGIGCGFGVADPVEELANDGANDSNDDEHRHGPKELLVHNSVKVLFSQVKPYYRWHDKQKCSEEQGGLDVKHSLTKKTEPVS